MQRCNRGKYQLAVSQKIRKKPWICFGGCRKVFLCATMIFQFGRFMAMESQTRRNFFRIAGAAGVSALAAPRSTARFVAPAVVGVLDLGVKKVERTWIRIPFRPVPARNMIRELPSWNIFEICKVTLGCGVVGFGETMVYYTTTPVSDDAVGRTIGRNAAELLWDDSLGAGLQMALFDAVGKVVGLPIHRLLGPKHRDRAFLSWWAIDMSGQDWVLECKDAVAQGYTDFKSKARPWFDLDGQCRTLIPTLPDDFHIDFDFNSTLLDSTHAGRYLAEIEKYKQVAIYETPLPPNDILGYKLLRLQTRVPLALHLGNPEMVVILKEDICDGFVIGGGASQVMSSGTLSAGVGKPFWLQVTGTGVTSTFALHLAAVLSHARWPAVNCHQLFTHQMIRPAIRVENGTAPVPEAPGLGVELDGDAVERFRIEPFTKGQPPRPDLLLAIHWSSGATRYYAYAWQYFDDFMSGRLPIYAKGVYLERIPDDGSREWKELRARAAQNPVHSGKPLKL